MYTCGYKYVAGWYDVVSVQVSDLLRRNQPVPRIDAGSFEEQQKR